jgi:hypothetical protein
VCRTDLDSGQAGGKDPTLSRVVQPKGNKGLLEEGPGTLTMSCLFSLGFLHSTALMMV